MLSRSEGRSGGGSVHPSGAGLSHGSRPLGHGRCAGLPGVPMAPIGSFASPDPLAGHRGNLLGLLWTGGVVGNGVAHPGAALWPPMADGLSVLTWVHGLAIAHAVSVAMAAAPRATVCALIAALLTLSLALWLERDMSSTAGGRLLNLPTLFVAPGVA